MAKKEPKEPCDDCVNYNMEVPADVDGIVFDYQTDLRKEKLKLNKYQVLFKMVKEWKELRVGRMLQ